ncbi:MAG: hypothetical protein IJ137_01875 [Eubacterium sp.]|nr:hypothetical protein [Eubacterium sp.]
MSHKKMYISEPNKSPSFPLPSLPEDQWCDFRRDYESGSTLKAIAAKYLCDPRTVRRCIMLNKSSCELGRQTAPTKLAPYHSMIDRLYVKYIKESQDTKANIPAVTQLRHPPRLSGRPRNRNH